jgi:tRNA A-37 threonylcarbamoyl transferase component Bud32
VIVESDPDAEEFRKRAETPEEAERLGHEARLLEVARHPGVVQLLGRDGESLRLRLVAGRPLSEVTLTAAQMAQVAVTAATTLADLHDIGVVHGAICGHHILLDRGQQPVFCSFGRGRAHAGNGGPGPAETAADVTALAKTLLASGSATADTDRILSKAAADANGGSSARRLAHLLGSPPQPHHPRTTRLLAAAAVVVFVAAVAVVYAAGHHAAPAGPPAAAPTDPTSAGVPAKAPSAATASTVAGERPGPPPCPAVDRGCRPLSLPDGVITTPAGPYRIGQQGDLVVVVGRWRCAGPLPALLQPGTGEVWAWDAWADGGAPRAAQLVARIPGAVSLLVDPGPDRCDRLEVLRGHGDPVVIQPGGVHDRLTG